jgi:hypothetical protein
MKRRSVTLAVAVLLTALIGPPTTASAAGADVSHSGIHHQGQGIGDEEQPGGDADAENPSEESNEPAHHEDGDEGGDSGEGNTCAVAAGPVSVCVAQPR